MANRISIRNWGKIHSHRAYTLASCKSHIDERGQPVPV